MKWRGTRIGEATRQGHRDAQPRTDGETGGIGFGGAADAAGARGAGKVRPRAVPAAAMAQTPAGSDHVLAACEGVIDIVAVLFNVSSKDLRGPGRSTFAVSRVRQIAMYAAHVRLGFTMAEVGLGFGRDRTTVLHACHQIEDLREDAEFDDIVARVEQVIAVAFGQRARD